MQHKSKTLDELKEKGLIKDSDKDALYDKLLEIQKEKVQKKDKEIKRIINKMRENGFNFSEIQKDLRIS
jgi:DNA-binding transcriptional regulator YhcF (GntR family)